MTHISCDDPYKEYVCNGNSYMEEVGEFFSSQTAKSGTKYLHMLIFVVCVCVYYAIEDNVRRNKLNSKIAFVGKELGVVLIVFIVMFLVPSGSIVPELAHEKINVVEPKEEEKKLTEENVNVAESSFRPNESQLEEKSIEFMPSAYKQ